MSTLSLHWIVNKVIFFLQDLERQKVEMISLFNNLPDAILHLKKNDLGNLHPYDLLYCNGRTDQIFGVQLSGLGQ
jgi:hypothetical protein